MGNGKGESYRRRVARMLKILAMMNDGVCIRSSELSEALGVGRRTIQKDLKLLREHFPIEEGQERGCYRFRHGFHLKDLRLTREEIAVFLLTMHFLDPSPHLRQIGDSILKKLLRVRDDHTPFALKVEGIEDLDLNHPLVHRLVRAIEERRVVRMEGPLSEPLRVAPYRLVCLQGLWYLFGLACESKRLGLWPLWRIRRLPYASETFRYDKKEIEKILTERVHGPDFDEGKEFEVIVEVTPRAAPHFKLRRLLSSQEILQENEDGSLRLRFRISHDTDIDRLVKAWLPEIRVLKPKRYRERLLRELHAYLRRETKSGHP